MIVAIEIKTDHFGYTIEHVFSDGQKRNRGSQSTLRSAFAQITRLSRYFGLEKVSAYKAVLHDVKGV